MIEEVLGPVISLLVLAAIVGAVVMGIRAVTRRRGELAEPDPGIGTVRRLYFYTVCFVALMMAAIGIVQIAAFALDSVFGAELVSRPSRTGLATGLALTIVGLPLWALHWRIVVRQVGQLPVEARSVVRKAYIYLVLAVSAGVTIVAAINAAQWVLGAGASFSGSTWGSVGLWSVVWAYHWRLEAGEGQPTPETRAVRRLYIYLMSAVMLVLAAVGIGQLVHIVLRDGYGSLTSIPVLARSGLWQDPTRVAISIALVASPVWAAHWLYFARGDYESTLRQLYVYALGVFGGISTVLSAVGIMLYGVLVWTLGAPDEESASDHFRFLPGALASLMVGGGILVYHATVARNQAAVPALSLLGGRRSYPYALSALGLGMLTVGIGILVNTVLTMLVDSGAATIVGRDVWRNWVLASVTLGILGAPLWWAYWSSMQRRVIAVGEEERTLLPRRVFIFGILGLGMLALLVSVSTVVFMFLRELLDGDLSVLLREAKGAIAVIVPAAIFLPYYWMVYRADRRETAGAEVVERYRRKAVTALVAGDGTAFVKELESILGYQVIPLRWADPEAALPELSDEAYQDLAQRVSDAEGLSVLLVPDGAGFRVFSYT